MTTKQQCDKCGCSPCDCGKGIKESMEGFQPTTLEQQTGLRREWEPPTAATRIMGLILRRGRRLPDKLKNASLEQVQAFFAGAR